jgi:hypothetical protein
LYPGFSLSCAAQVSQAYLCTWLNMSIQFCRSLLLKDLDLLGIFRVGEKAAVNRWSLPQLMWRMKPLKQYVNPSKVTWNSGALPKLLPIS